MTTLTDADLARLSALAEAATEPPWLHHPAVAVNSHPTVETSDRLVAAIGNAEFGNPARWQQWENDAAFIAAARDAVPKLVAEVRRLREALGIFLGSDGRFQIAVGGNPIAVEKMLAKASALVNGEKG